MTAVGFKVFGNLLPLKGHITKSGELLQSALEVNSFCTALV
jgi:hypothetical protein